MDSLAKRGVRVGSAYAANTVTTNPPPERQDARDDHHGEREQMVAVGRVGRSYGVRGWLHIQSSMEPPEDILAHRRWWLTNSETASNARPTFGAGGGQASSHERGASIGTRSWTSRNGSTGDDAWRPVQIAESRVHGNGVVARFEGIDSREAAQALTGAALGLPRDVLPELEDDEFYWADLLGCAVVDVEGEPLGELKAFMETGANDVMVVAGERERLIPFVMDEVVQQVDVDNARIVVAWDADF